MLSVLLEMLWLLEAAQWVGKNETEWAPSNTKVTRVGLLMI